MRYYGSYLLLLRSCTLQNVQNEDKCDIVRLFDNMSKVSYLQQLLLGYLHINIALVSSVLIKKHFI